MAVRAILAGALTSCAGIVVAAADHPTVGGVVVVAGWVTFVFGIHRFGRQGPETQTE